MKLFSRNNNNNSNNMTMSSEFTTTQSHTNSTPRRGGGGGGGGGSYEIELSTPFGTPTTAANNCNNKNGMYEMTQRMESTTTTTTTEEEEVLSILPGASQHDEDTSSIDPHASNLGNDLTSAILGIIKAMVGPAILYLPHGFASAGYLIAIPIMIITTILYLHSSKCLLDVWKSEQQKDIQQVQQQEQEHDSTSTTGTGTTSGTYNPLLLNDDDDDDDDETRKNISQLQYQQQQQAVSLSYHELARRAYGIYGETIVKIGIAFMQSGVCLTYFIFVPHNLQSSVQRLIGWNLPTSLYLFIMVVLQIPLSFIRDIRKFTPTNTIANLLIIYGLVLCLYFAIQQAATTSTTSSSSSYNEESSTAMISSEEDYNRKEQDTTTTNNNNNNNNSAIYNLWDHLLHLTPLGEHWIIFIGTSVLLFEGSITLLLPLQEAVEGNGNDNNGEKKSTSTTKGTTSTTTTTNTNVSPVSDRDKFPIIYKQVIISIQIFYVFFGLICWMSFGNNVHTVLTTSLPIGGLATTVQLAYSIAVLFTFPLQNYPAIDISTKFIIQTLIQYSTHPVLLQYQNSYPILRTIWSYLLQRNILSSILVCSLAIVAYTTMDSLDKVVSLMGSLIGCPIAFIIPPMIHTKLVLEEEQQQQQQGIVNSTSSSNLVLIKRRKQQNYIVSLLGTIAMIIASLTTIWQWND